MQSPKATVPVGILCILCGNVNNFLCLYKANWFVGSDYKVNKHEIWGGATLPNLLQPLYYGGNKEYDVHILS